MSNRKRSYELREGRVTIATPGPDPLNGDNNIFILIENATRATFPVKPGVWRLSLRGVAIEKGTIDAWTLATTDDPVIFTGTSVKDKMKIGSPGASRSAITVAAYTTRINWTDINGQEEGVDFDLDDIADFSSEGPLRDGFNKPDIADSGGYDSIGPVRRLPGQPHGAAGQRILRYGRDKHGFALHCRCGCTPAGT